MDFWMRSLSGDIIVHVNYRGRSAWETLTPLDALDRFGIPLLEWQRG